MSLFLGS
jgi:hypothetical protein